MCSATSGSISSQKQPGIRRPVTQISFDKQLPAAVRKPGEIQWSRWLDLGLHEVRVCSMLLLSASKQQHSTVKYKLSGSTGTFVCCLCCGYSLCKRTQQLLRMLDYINAGGVLCMSSPMHACFFKPPHTVHMQNKQHSSILLSHLIYI